MRKIILYIAASIDGFIARSDGSTDWLEDFKDDYGYEEFLGTIDTTIMGYRTYEQVLTFDKFPYSDKLNYIITRKENESDSKYKINFLRPDQLEIIRRLKDVSGQDIWLIGGGMTNSLFLQNGLIDEIRLFVMPVILGEGIALFSGHDSINNLKQYFSHSFNDGTIEIRYRL